MIIKKEYKFYAAHRNNEFSDKCGNLHGHRYGLIMHFDVERNGSVTTPFADFDDKIEPHIKSHYDHGMLIDVQDPLYETLLKHMERTGENLKLKILPGPTSVENLAHQLFSEITDMGFLLNRIEVRETDSSIVVYTHQDWVNDNRSMSFRSAASIAQDR